MSATDSSSESWGSYSTISVANSSVSDVLKVFSTWASHLLVNNMVLKENIRFLDVACGWGYLSTAFIERLLEAKYPLARCHLDVTDYAAGMVTSANTNLEELCNKHNIVSSSSLYDCFVMDGCNPTITSSTVSHIGCMFGIMFFPEIDVSLSRLHSTLQPGGSAYFGTWKYADTAEITFAFCKYLHLEESVSIDKVKHFLSIGQSAADMADRLSRAGYVNIRVEEKEEIFEIENTSMALYNALVMNPVLGPCFESFSGSEEDLYQQYLAFGRDEHASQPWSMNHGQAMRMKMIANLSIGYRAV